NVLNLPYLWSGVWGTWPLGWVDTVLPWVVPLAAIAAVVGAGFVGLAVKDARLRILIGVVAVLLFAVPLWTLQRGHDLVGVEVQPRYLLPLIGLLVGLLMTAPVGRRIRLGRGQAWTIAVALSVANLV